MHGQPYRKIFASYSHKDLSIVRQFEIFVAVFGDEFMRDWTHLRAGQNWSEGLESMISKADVFQLFWSTNSMKSEFVRQEWEYALRLNRASFIRPVYWEQPMPEQPNKGLPPEILRKLHFHRVSLSARIVEVDDKAGRESDLESRVESSDIVQEVPRRGVTVASPRSDIFVSLYGCLWSVILGLAILSVLLLRLARETNLISWPWWWVLTPLVIPIILLTRRAMSR